MQAAIEAPCQWPTIGGQKGWHILLFCQYPFSLPLSQAQLSQADGYRTEKSLRSAHGSQSFNSQLIQPLNLPSARPYIDVMGRKKISVSSIYGNMEQKSNGVYFEPRHITKIPTFAGHV